MAIAAVILVVCTGGIVFVANWDRITSGNDDGGPGPQPTGDPPVELAGWDNCSERPNECNSGAVQQGGTLVWGASGADSWNLHTSLGSTQTLTQVLSGVLPTSGSFLPDSTWQWNLDLLAEEPAQVGEDPDTYQYRIRPEAKWSDGTDITADDFIFQWRHNSGSSELCDECASISTAGYNRIERVEGSDGGKTATVTFRTDQPYPDWFSLFTGLYPAHVAEAAGFDLATPTGMAEAFEWFHDAVPDWSGGPWQVAPGADLYDQVVLEPNDQWYGQTYPALDQIVFEMIADPAAMRLALESGDIDGFGPRIDPGPEDEITAADVLSRVESSYVWDHLDFNLDREWTGDAALRRAIFTAIDIEAVINLAYGMPAPDTEPRRNHLFGPSSPHYEDHLTATGQGSGDVDTALAILDGAGYELDDGVLTNDGEPVGPLVLAFSEGQARRQAIAEVVASQLDELGIEVTLQPDNLGTILLEDLDYDIVIFGWGSSPTFLEEGRDFWHSDGGSNFGGYTNDEVDALTDEAANASSRDEAAALLNQAMQILVDDAYVLPIAATPGQIAVRDSFRNIRPHPAEPGAIFSNSHEWGISG